MGGHNGSYNKTEANGDIEEEGKSMTFADFLEMVIRLRADNTPSVADIVELRKLIFKGQRTLTKHLSHIERTQADLHKHFRLVGDQLDVALMLSADFGAQDKTADVVSSGPSPAVVKDKNVGARKHVSVEEQVPLN